MDTHHRVDIRRSIISPIASFARTIFLLLACLLLVVAVSSWYLQHSGGIPEPASSKLQRLEHQRPLSYTSLLPHHRRLVGSSGENCTRKCGNMSIPYPFGLSPECARGSYFQLTCKNTSGVTGYKGQILPGWWPFLENKVHGSFQENGTVLPLKEHLLDSFQVLSINLTQATMVIDTTNIKGSSCYADTGNFNLSSLGNFASRFASMGNASIRLPLGGRYRLSGSNVFVVVGCTSQGVFSDQPIINYGNSSASNHGLYLGQCGPNNCADQYSFDYCNAFDCCVLSAQPSLNFYLLGGGGTYAHSSVCGYGSLLYPPSYTTAWSGLFGSATYGAQLLWALSGGGNFSNCSLLERSQNYACSPSPATCINVNQETRSTSGNIPNLVGYYCRCSQAGYQGDGYINGTGCKDIDECRDPDLNECDSESKAICTNYEGSYHCSCPTGMRGDGFKNGTRCSNVDPKGNKTLFIIGGTVGGTLFLLSGWISFVIIWRLKKRLHVLQEFQQALEDRQVQLPFFSYHDLISSTGNFLESNKLGSGAFGVVYKGILRDGTPIAVKRLFNLEKGEVLNDFLNKVVLITGIKHKNLVQLKGCCINNEERILIYEYAENGHVAEALWGKDTREKLDWVHRLNICMGVARGLSYLHEELHPRIIHGDIKLANILLDANWNSKIADFGLAKPFMEEDTRAQFSLLAGTKGYLAPEYVLYGQLTAKADVYSFGVLVLEIISGRKYIDLSLPPDKVSLKNMAQDLQSKGKSLDLLKPELITNLPKSEVMNIINIALACVQTDPNFRPTMSQVVSMLSGNMEATTFSNYNNKGKFGRNALDIFVATHRYEEEGTSSSSGTRYETTVTEEFEGSETKPFFSKSQSFPIRIWDKIRARVNTDGASISMTKLSNVDEETDRLY